MTVYDYTFDEHIDISVAGILSPNAHFVGQLFYTADLLWLGIIIIIIIITLFHTLSIKTVAKRYFKTHF